MKIAVRETQLFIRNLTLRIPFRYGIATMTRVPHLVLRAVVEIDGRLQPGFAADNLPPKWFTKNPETSFAEEIADMLEGTQSAAALARSLPPAESVFAWWQAASRAQESWALSRGFPPLLAGFGTSHVERAVIDAFCRATGQTFATAVRNNTFAVRLGDIHPELAGAAPADFLPSPPASSVIARHTVGMTDALEEIEPHGEPDGLPHSLEEFIRVQGLTHFKIKLGGDIAQDRARLQRIAALVGRTAGHCAFTLDGNENFRAVAPFRALWEGLQADRNLAGFLDGLIFVEQPFHRDVALSPATTVDLLAWKERPPIIIDESDDRHDAVRVALAGGYVGTSHKNCKGVFHGIANGCLIEKRRREHPALALQMSGEDLTNLGPIALPQDLAVAATLGIRHLERNGHHYFAGLSQFPEAIQGEVLRHHPDLYTTHPSGYPVVSVRSGAMAIGTVIDAPFGVGFEPDLSAFTPVEDWRFESM